jgi:hypothetical protein
VATVGWRVYLDGDAMDLDILRSALTGGDMVVLSDDHGTYLAGMVFASASAPAEVLLRAGELLPRLNGVGHLIDFGFQPVRLSGRVANGEQPATVFAEAHLRGRSRLSAGGEPAVAASTLQRADRDQAFDQVLRLIGASPTLDWVDLYKICELLTEDAGGKKQYLARADVTNSDHEAFTTSANHPAASGGGARHAVMHGQPRRTMTPDQGRAFILGIVRRW